MSRDVTGQTKKPRILVFSEYYRPGYKSGGGMRTIANMVDRMSDRFDFRIITHDHDGNLDTAQYTTVKIDEWTTSGDTGVYYISGKNIGLKVLRKLILSVDPGAIYTNSFFSPFTRLLLQLRKLKLIPDKRIAIAPCGELSDGAMQRNAGKKKLFVGVSKAVDLYTDVIWKASAALEKAEIERIGAKNSTIMIAPDLPAHHLIADYQQHQKPRKKSSEARMVFFSRFVRKKNFKWLLEHLGSNIDGRLHIDILGPLEDAEYWNECQEIIRKLPANITVTALGPMPHETALRKMLEYHFFVLPTLGENFGHVFIEALSAGCPMLISDRTPWLELAEKRIGWDISLDEPQKWGAKINQCIDMDANEYEGMSAAARRYSVEWLADTEIEKPTETVLYESLGISS
jgi:glycosyltransferase involved in cell wall biosynthesis